MAAPCDGILARSDLCGRPAFHGPPYQTLILFTGWGEGGGELGLLGYWLVISNRGINFVSDGITTIINRSAPSSPFNFPQMIEKKYIEPAFMFSNSAIGPFRLTSDMINLKTNFNQLQIPIHVYELIDPVLTRNKLNQSFGTPKFKSD